jgi:hypothetical protein
MPPPPSRYCPQPARDTADRIRRVGGLTARSSEWLRRWPWCRERGRRHPLLLRLLCLVASSTARCVPPPPCIYAPNRALVDGDGDGCQRLDGRSARSGSSRRSRPRARGPPLLNTATCGSVVVVEVVVVPVHAVEVGVGPLLGPTITSPSRAGAVPRLETVEVQGERHGRPRFPPVMPRAGVRASMAHGGASTQRFAPISPGAQRTPR